MTQEKINALGFIEVRGLAAAIETADAMLKSAQVRLLRQLLRDPMQTTLTVEGELGACQAAIDAGRAAATRMGAFVTCHVMGRPAGDTAQFVLTLAEAGRQPFGPAQKARVGDTPSVAQTREVASSVPAASDDASDATSDALADAVAAISALDRRLIDTLTGLPGGFGVQQLVRRVGGTAASVRHRLDALRERGVLAKRGARYLLAEYDGDKQ